MFHAATARVENGDVVAGSPEVPAPVAVRFGWHETASPNLINSAGLPAVPFRSDDWPLELSRPVSAASQPR